MKKIICLLLFLMASGLASAGDRLTGDELKMFYADKTVFGVHFKSGARKTYFGTDGTVHSKSDKGAELLGKWWISDDGDKRCVKWNHKAKDLCHYTERNKDGTHTLVHGKKKGKKLVEISKTMDGNQL